MITNQFYSQLETFFFGRLRAPFSQISAVRVYSNVSKKNVWSWGYNRFILIGQRFGMTDVFHIPSMFLSTGMAAIIILNWWKFSRENILSLWLAMYISYAEVFYKSILDKILERYSTYLLLFQKKCTPNNLISV